MRDNEMTEDAMNETHGFCWAASQIVDLQPLKFGKPQKNGSQVSYRAVVPPPPSDPLFALTVSTTIPDVGREDAERNLKNLLDGLRVDFLLTASRNDDDDDDSDEAENEPDDDSYESDLEVLITPEFVGSVPNGEYDVIFLAQTPIPVVSKYTIDIPTLHPPTLLPPALPAVPQTNITRRTKHVYRSVCGDLLRPRVQCDSNVIHAFPGNFTITAPHHHRVSKKTKRVTIINYDWSNSSVYEMNFSWKLIVNVGLLRPQTSPGSPSSSET